MHHPLFSEHAIKLILYLHCRLKKALQNNVTLNMFPFKETMSRDFARRVNFFIDQPHEGA
jgi:hypothetical protein